MKYLGVDTDGECEFVRDVHAAPQVAGHPLQVQRAAGIDDPDASYEMGDRSCLNCPNT